MNKYIKFAFSLLVFVALFSGCSKTNQTSSLSIIYTQRACSNSNIPRDEVQDEIKTICDNTGEVFVYTCDGQPKLIDGFKMDKSYSKTSKGKAINDQIVNTILSTLEESCVASSPESNVLKAIHMVSDSINSCKYQKNTLVIIDSMLTTTSPLDFSTYDLLNMDVDLIIDQLKSNANLPDLSNVDVIVYNLGSVSYPQNEMTYSAKEKLQSIWQEVFSASNAKSIEFVNKPSVESSSKDASLPNVSLVDISEDIYMFEDVVLDNTQLGFLPDTANFVDYNQAVEVLKSYSESIDKSKGVLIIGSTARVGDNSNSAFDLELSKARADKVKEILISLGADPTKLQTFGLGFDHPFRVENDEQKNRSVTITDKNSEMAKRLAAFLKEGDI